MGKLVSVVVPVRNGATTIKACIDNLLSQTYDNVEILIVESNSTDDTWDRLQELKKQEPYEGNHLRIYQSSKPGASAARNLGLKMATGDYLIFMDADDSVEQNLVETLVDAIDRDEDTVLVTAGYRTYQTMEENKAGENRTGENRAGGNDLPQLLYESPAVSCHYDLESMVERLFLVEDYIGFVWGKIYRMDIIRERLVSFRENIKYNEDRLFVVEYLCAAYNMVTIKDLESASALMISDHLYNYLLHEDSITGETRSRKEVSIEEISEIAAFDLMLQRIALSIGASSRAFAAGHLDMIHSELRMFRRMIGPKQIFKYTNSPMRVYAKLAGRVKFEPSCPKEEILWKIFKRYGRTGCTYTKNPEFFRELY